MELKKKLEKIEEQLKQMKEQLNYLKEKMKRIGEINTQLVEHYFSKKEEKNVK
jgi:prefoldin subunit 5